MVALAGQQELSMLFFCMLAKVHSGAVYGIDAYPVEIEVNEGRGDVPSPRLWNTGPQTIIVGLPGSLVKTCPHGS